RASVHEVDPDTVPRMCGDRLVLERAVEDEEGRSVLFHCLRIGVDLPGVRRRAVDAVAQTTISNAGGSAGVRGYTIITPAMPILMCWSVIGPAAQWYMKTPGTETVPAIASVCPASIGPNFPASMRKAWVSRPCAIVPLFVTLRVTVSPTHVSSVGPG